ncbi:sensor domain-containing protein [Mycolicibacterium thermoresistibile]
MGTARVAVAAAAAGALLAGCAATVTGTAVAPIALDRILPTAAELSDVLGAESAGFLGQLVEGDADTLLRGVGPADASPPDCVGATYRMQQVVYERSPVRAVATRPWTGGDVADPAGPSVSAYLGVVELASADDAHDFFTATVQDWRRCDGQTVQLHQPDHGTRTLSTISDVVIDGAVVSAVVSHDAGQRVQRALGVAADCIVDVEVSHPRAPVQDGAATDAVEVVRLMLDKVSAG